VGSFFILLFEAAEQQQVIGHLVESVGRFIVWAVLLTMIYFVSRSTILDPPAWKAGMVCGVLILVGLAIGVTEDVRSLDSIPLVGHDSKVRPFVEKAIMCGWSCASLFLVFYLVRSLERGNRELKTEVREKSLAVERLKQAERKAIQRERLSALGQMSSGVAHDISNALAPVITYCELLQTEEIPADETKTMLEGILRGSLHAADVAKQLQFFYRDSKDEGFARVDLVRLVNDTVSLTKPKWHDDAVHCGKQITVREDLPEFVFVNGNATELKQVLTNLVFNAVEAISKRGLIEICVTKLTDCAEIRVTDDGKGMPEAVRLKCFEPFFTRSEQGSGLGLSVCHGVIKRHGGTIEVASEEGNGTEVTINLPTAKKLSHASRGATRVLYIDDDERLRDSTERMLRAFGAEVDVAKNGPAGLGMLVDRNYDVVITDMGMSGMSGRQVFQAVKQFDASIPVIVVSGWSADDVANEFRGELQPHLIFTKPVTMDSMRVVLAAIPKSNRSP